MARSSVVLANKFLLTIHLCALLALFWFVFFFWNTDLYSDVISNIKNIQETRDSTLFEKRRRLCSPLSGCIYYRHGDEAEVNINTSSTQHENIVKKCYNYKEGKCIGSVRCCRDCRVVAFASMWNHPEGTHSSTGKLAYHFTFSDARLHSLKVSLSWLVTILCVHIMGIVASACEVKLRPPPLPHLYTKEKDLILLRERDKQKRKWKLTFTIVWLSVCFVVVATLSLIIYGIFTLLLDVGQANMLFTNPVKECRLVFFSNVSWLWVVFLFFMDYVLSLNLNYRCHEIRRKRTMKKLIRKGCTQTEEEVSLIQSTLNMIETHTGMEGDKSINANGVLSVKGRCSESHSFCNYMSTAVYRSVMWLSCSTIIWWIVLCTDIMLLYNGSCLIPGNCK